MATIDQAVVAAKELVFETDSSEQLGIAMDALAELHRVRQYLEMNLSDAN
jgi:hypothetical protein